MLNIFFKIFKIPFSFIYIFIRFFPFPIRILLYGSIIVTIYLIFDI